jgi:hypothetical protein
MTRRAFFAGKQELTPTPARLDQCSNLNPCSLHGPYEFWAKRTKFTSFVPKGDTSAPKKQRSHARRRRLCNKMPGNCRAFQFSGEYNSNRMSAVKTAFVKAASVEIVAGFAASPKVLASACLDALDLGPFSSIGVERRLKRAQGRSLISQDTPQTVRKPTGKAALNLSGAFLGSGAARFLDESRAALQIV